MKNSFKKILASSLALAMVLTGISVPCKTMQAANKPTVAKKASVYVGKTKTLSVKANGYTIKKVTVKTSAKKVATVTANKKVVKIKGVKAGSAVITTTIKAAKAGKTKTFSIKTNVTVKTKVVEQKKTVTSLADLESALTEVQKTGGKVTLSTAEASSLTIAEADYSKVDLIVNAPSADIENAATFRSVTIEAIKASTWRENGKGNRFKVTATEPVRIVVAATATVASLVFSGTSTTASSIEVAGTVDSLKVASTGYVNIAAEGAQAKISEVDVTATGAKVSVTADTEATVATVKVEANADVTVAGTSANATSVQTSDPNATVTVTAPNATVTNTSAGDSGTGDADSGDSGSGGGSGATSGGGNGGSSAVVDPFAVTLPTLSDKVVAINQFAEYDATVKSVPSGATVTYQWYEASSSYRSDSDAKWPTKATSSECAFRWDSAGVRYVYCEATVTGVNGTILTTSSYYTNVAKVTVSNSSSGVGEPVISDQTTNIKCLKDWDEGSWLWVELADTTGYSVTYQWYSVDAQGALTPLTGETDEDYWATAPAVGETAKYQCEATLVKGTDSLTLKSDVMTITTVKDDSVALVSSASEFEAAMANSSKTKIKLSSSYDESTRLTNRLSITDREIEIDLNGKKLKAADSKGAFIIYGDGGLSVWGDEGSEIISNNAYATIYLADGNPSDGHNPYLALDGELKVTNNGAGNFTYAGGFGSAVNVSRNGHRGTITPNLYIGRWVTFSTPTNGYDVTFDDELMADDSDGKLFDTTTPSNEAMYSVINSSWNLEDERTATTYQCGYISQPGALNGAGDDDDVNAEEIIGYKK